MFSVAVFFPFFALLPHERVAGPAGLLDGLYSLPSALGPGGPASPRAAGLLLPPSPHGQAAWSSVP